MSLPRHLLEQARHLATRPGPARQADLRRALSAAYYALFHMLVRDGAASFVSGEGLRHLVGRAFTHLGMRTASRQFAAAGLPPDLVALAPGGVPADLRDVASAFADLQGLRHEADYNTAARFTRAQTLNHVVRAERAFQQWRAVRTQPVARLYLCALLLAESWRR
jgi:hypothetical protein